MQIYNRTSNPFQYGKLRIAPNAATAIEKSDEADAKKLVALYPKALLTLKDNETIPGAGSENESAKDKKIAALEAELAALKKNLKA